MKATHGRWDRGRILRALGTGTAAMADSEKLFYWVFQQHPDRILELVP